MSWKTDLGILTDQHYFTDSDVLPLIAQPINSTTTNVGVPTIYKELKVEIIANSGATGIVGKVSTLATASEVDTTVSEASLDKTVSFQVTLNGVAAITGGLEISFVNFSVAVVGSSDFSTSSNFKESNLVSLVAAKNSNLGLLDLINSMISSVTSLSGCVGGILEHKVLRSNVVASTTLSKVDVIMERRLRVVVYEAAYCWCRPYLEMDLHAQVLSTVGKAQVITLVKKIQGQISGYTTISGIIHHRHYLAGYIDAFASTEAKVNRALNLGGKVDSVTESQATLVAGVWVDLKSNVSGTLNIVPKMSLYKLIKGGFVVQASFSFIISVIKLVKGLLVAAAKAIGSLFTKSKYDPTVKIKIEGPVVLANRLVDYCEITTQVTELAYLGTTEIKESFLIETGLEVDSPINYLKSILDGEINFSFYVDKPSVRMKLTDISVRKPDMNHDSTIPCKLVELSRIMGGYYCEDYGEEE